MYSENYSKNVSLEAGFGVAIEYLQLANLKILKV